VHLQIEIALQIPTLTSPNSQLLPPIFLLNPPIQNLIHNPHLLRLLRPHKLIPLHQPLNLLNTMLPRQMPLINPIQLLPHPQYLLGMNRNIARLPEIPPGRLMHHHTAVRQAETLPRRAPAQQQRAHRGCLTHAGGGDGGGDVGHGVVDGEAGGDGAAGRVDVEGYGAFGGVGFEEEELRYYARGGGFVYGAVEADDAFLDRVIMGELQRRLFWGRGEDGYH